MLATSEDMMVDPQGELQALLADYESFVANGVLPPVGVEPLDGAIANELPVIDDSDIMTFTDDPMIVAPAQDPAPTVEPTATTSPDPAPADPAPAMPPPADPAPSSGPAMDDPTAGDPNATPTDADPTDVTPTDAMPTDSADPAPVDPLVVVTLGAAVEGGAGENVFEIHGMSSRFVNLGQITDFTQGEDVLRFDGAIAATPENFALLTAESYEDAQLAAIRLIENGQADYVAVQVADDVIVFGDNGADVVDAAVVLAGRRLTDIGIHDVG